MEIAQTLAGLTLSHRLGTKPLKFGKLEMF